MRMDGYLALGNCVGPLGGVVVVPGSGAPIAGDVDSSIVALMVAPVTVAIDVTKMALDWESYSKDMVIQWSSSGGKYASP